METIKLNVSGIDAYGNAVYEHHQIGLGYNITYPEKLIETYVRSWGERLFSLPWRPWVRIGERETTFALINKRMIDAQTAMQHTLESAKYGRLSV